MVKPRLQVPGGYYHLGTRGNNQEAIFRDRLDRIEFLMLLTAVARKYGWRVLAYCLMTNHYHLVMQIGDMGMSQGFCELNSGFARSFNKRHGRTNHLFGRRYWDRLVETDEYLRESVRYTVLNPVRAGLTERPADWAWSSYRACAGIDYAVPFLDVQYALGLFERPNAFAARRAFRHYVREGLDERQPTKTKCREGAT